MFGTSRNPAMLLCLEPGEVACYNTESPKFRDIVPLILLTLAVCFSCIVCNLFRGESSVLVCSHLWLFLLSVLPCHSSLSYPRRCFPITSFLSVSAGASLSMSVPGVWCYSIAMCLLFRPFLRGADRDRSAPYYSLYLPVQAFHEILSTDYCRRSSIINPQMGEFSLVVGAIRISWGGIIWPSILGPSLSRRLARGWEIALKSSWGGGEWRGEVGGGVWGRGERENSIGESLPAGLLSRINLFNMNVEGEIKLRSPYTSGSLCST
jgi:hypothetical protein